MARFLVHPSDLAGNHFTLVGSEARHACTVLRKKVGDELDLFDGRDRSFRGRITAISNERVVGELTAESPSADRLGVEVILAQALIKGPKWDWLLEKAAEIGVHRLVPLYTQRTVIQPTDRASQKQDRWEKIVLAATKQCGRRDTMRIDPAVAFSEALSQVLPGDHALIPWEKETAKHIRDVLPETGVQRVWLFVGPEGGWDTRETDLAVRRGVLPVCLGPTLLRSETAGLASVLLALARLRVY